MGRWDIAPGWRERLQSGGAIDWFALEGDPRATIVKANPNRRVWRVRLGDAALYVKAFRAAGWGDRLRSLFRGPEAVSEWRVGRSAAAAGVPSVGLVACGVRGSRMLGPESVLITEAAEEAVSLPEAWREAVGEDARAGRGAASRGLTEAVARLVAGAHAARFLHRDGHPRNILVRRAGGTSPEVLYVDLYGASTGTVLSDERAAGGLAQLDQWFARHASRSARLRFLKAYLAERFGDDGVSHELVGSWTSAVDGARRGQAAGLYAQRDRRLRRRGKYFAAMPLAGGWRATTALSFRNRDEFPQPIHPDRTAVEVRQWLEGMLSSIDQGGRWPADVGVERFVPQGFAQRVAWTLTDGPAWGAFAAGHGLRHRNIPCVWPVAVLQRRSGFLMDECVLITERRPGAVSLVGLLDGSCSGADRWHDVECRRAILESVGRLLADMNSAGVIWAAAEPPQVWIEWIQPAGEPRALIGSADGLSFVNPRTAEPVEEFVEAFIQGLQRRASAAAADLELVREAFRRRLVWFGRRAPRQAG
ncbi:MAG TPA: lipopolysaccharide kinase InaA family protein [Phycisphaerae bacterium]|nr:lipopolysaccharide kinase InaA family protein [Phycisphaerae bacterium]